MFPALETELKQVGSHPSPETLAQKAYSGGTFFWLEILIPKVE